MRLVLLVLAIAFIAIQFVRYGRDHTNPPVALDAPRPTAEAERVARAACYDCHSSETHWPWYSHVAPMSWLVYEDGEMPPSKYTMLHRDANLSADEDRALVAAAERMHRKRDDRGSDD